MRLKVSASQTDRRTDTYKKKNRVTIPHTGLKTWNWLWTEYGGDTWSAKLHMTIPFTGATIWRLCTIFSRNDSNEYTFKAYFILKKFTKVWTVFRRQNLYTILRHWLLSVNLVENITYTIDVLYLHIVTLKFGA